MIRRGAWRFRWLCLLLLVLPSSVSAQDAEAPSREAATERARQLFAEGLELAEEGDWERAVHRFRRALELREAAPVRFNLATSLFRMGRLMEAIEELDRILADGSAEEQVREASHELREELIPRLGRLTVEVRGDAEDTQVSVDGRPWDSIGVAALSDPGVRVVRLLRGMEELDVEEADVPEGGAARVVLEAVSGPDVLAVADGSSEGASTESGDRAGDDGWIWGVVIGAVLVVAGAAVVTGVVVADQGPATSMGDFMPPVLEIGP